MMSSRKQGRRLTFSVRNKIGRGVKQAYTKSCCFKMMLHKPRSRGSKGLGDVVVGAKLQAEHAVIFAGTRRQKNDGDGGEGSIGAKTPAHVEAVSTGNHDVEKEERRRLALGVRNEIGGGKVRLDTESRRFKVMLHKPRNIGVIFQHKNGLAQPVCPRRRPYLKFGGGGRTESSSDYCKEANKLQTLC